MKHFVRVLAVAIVAAFVAGAFTAGPIRAQGPGGQGQGGGRGGPPPPPPPALLAWAFPAAPPGTQREADDGSLKKVPGSTLALTQTQIDNAFGPPDWYPNEHPAMPGVVSHGRPVDGQVGVLACGLCHLPNGLGHPESAGLTGLSAPYITEQLIEWRSGARTGLNGAGGIMANIAKAATDAEIKDAADYFGSLKPSAWVKVVESATAPKSAVGVGNMRFSQPGAGTEPLGQRIIELPADDTQAKLRDGHSGFVAYVPVGSVKKGEALVGGGQVVNGKITGGKTIQCNICHGAGLKGLGYAPALAGRSPIYIVRQLYFLKDGRRTGPMAELMKETVSKLSEEDMLNIAAYTASLAP